MEGAVQLRCAEWKLIAVVSNAINTPKKEKPRQVGAFLYINFWRREPESNRPKRLCRPLHNRFAIAPQADWNLAADSQVCLVGHRYNR